MPEQTHDRLKWWREARFGMFIHWGVYAVPAGTWKGKQIPGLGEWIMRNARIPIPEYEKLAGQFNPVKFDAEAWVQLAKRAGMKYIVITSKHHDGFCMFRSASNPYNIVDRTPYGKDPMKALAEACARHGLKLCFYYSQSQDWHAPGGAGHWEEADAEGLRNWNKYPGNLDRFAAYLENVVKPNLHELLTQYGPIGLIWFDTPVCISREQSEDLRDYVHKLQPDCLVSGRIGNNVGDYGSMGDNQIPVGRVQGDWETPATLNDTWGFKSYDHNWKSVDDLLFLLIELAGKGVNYLLNVGPTAEGLIPEPSVKLLEAMGEWMTVNEEAIRGTQASPYPYDFEWGRLTRKGNKLYLLITKWPDRPLKLFGLRNVVRGAVMLGARDAGVVVEQCHETAEDRHIVELKLPAAAPDPRVSVVRLDLDGEVDVDETPQQQADGAVSLPAHMATLMGSVTIGRSGSTENWTDTSSALSWEFRAREPGMFRVELYTMGNRHSEWNATHTVRLTVGGNSITAKIGHDGDSRSPRAQYFPEVISALGEVPITKAGTVQVQLEVLEMAPGTGQVQVAEVRLIPA
ncbi:MAG: alpha-L-fucosidase [Kiritimatiellaeota bacterium]|nr:alpha-L-fucosidase [Kiritimatiellota bacterium]